jgi:hypothetical protein
MACDILLDSSRRVLLESIIKSMCPEKAPSTKKTIIILMLKVIIVPMHQFIVENLQLLISICFKL